MKGVESELWVAPDTGGGAPAARRMDSVNGIAGGASYLPVSTAHTRDEVRNYPPTVNPIASGGYYWVVFTSRRMYGNVADSDPYGGSPDSGTTCVEEFERCTADADCCDAALRCINGRCAKQGPK